MHEKYLLQNTKSSINLYILPILIVFLLGIFSLLYPFGRDQGEYATIAAGWLNGEVVYRDIFNIKPPLTHMVHALAIILFGHSMMAIRVLDLIWQAITVLLLVRLVEIIFQKKILGILAAILYAAWYFSFGFWDTAQTDGFITLFVLASLLFYVKYMESRKFIHIFGCGFFIGIAVLFKYPIGVLLIFLIIHQALEKDKYLESIFYLTTGFLLPIVFFLGQLVIQGALDEYLSTQFEYIPNYNFKINNGINPFIILFIYILVNPQILLSIFSIYILIKYYRSISNKNGLLIIFWWLASFIHLVSQNKYYFYHSLPLIAPSVFLVLFILNYLSNKEYQNKTKWIYLLSVIAISTLVIYIIPWILTNSNNIIALRNQGIDIHELNQHYFNYQNGDLTVSSDLEVASFLNLNTHPNDKIYIWGFEPTIYFLANRSPGSQFIDNYILHGALSSSLHRDSLMKELQTNKPIYIVVVKNDSIPWTTGTNQDSFDSFLNYPELVQLVSNEYKFDTQIEDFSLYRLKER